MSYVPEEKEIIGAEGFAAWKEFRADMEESQVWQDTHNDGRRLAFMAFCRAWNKKGQAEK